MNIKGRHILVTGSGKRLGRAIAESFLSSEVKLTAHYFTSKDQADELVVHAIKRGSQAQSVSCDLSQTEDIKRLVKDSEKKFGPIDILIHSAAIFPRTPILGVTPEEWNKTLDTNLRAAFFLGQVVAEGMLKQAEGLFLFLVDIWGAKPLRNYVPYSVSKGGLLSLMRNFATEWAPKIRVNSISPGTVLLPESFSKKASERATRNNLLGRLGAPSDIVQCVHFLIQNDYITGIDLKVDGGKSLL